MGKLFILKKFLTIPDAAKHLTIAFGEDVAEADILRLVLDGHFKLSVNLVNKARARVGRVVGWEETEWRLLPTEFSLLKDLKTLDTVEDFESIPLDAAQKIKEIPNKDKKNYFISLSSLCIDTVNKKFINLSDKVTSIDGIWDLPMIGCEALDVEHDYQMLTGGPAVTLQILEGTFLQKDDLTICQLQESFDDNEYQIGSKAQLEKIKFEIALNKIADIEAQNLLNKHIQNRKEYLEKRKKNADNDYYPAGCLPDDAVLIVRTDELRRFEQSLTQDEQKEKPLKTTERNTLLTIIAAMCKYEGIGPLDRTTTSKIVEMTEDLGAPVSDDTVRSILKKIPDAVDYRLK